MTSAIVLVKVHAGEITRHDEVERAIGIQIDERSCINSPEFFRSKSGLRSYLTQISSAVIDVKMAGVAIVRVVIGRGHAASGVGEFVLANENIQIAVVINIAAGDGARSKEIVLDEDTRRCFK